MIPTVLPLGAPPDVFAGAFGGIAALLIVGGALFLRGQRNRQQFILMQTALEKGITSFPGQPPFWLLSLRQGILTITLGIGLIIVGSGAWGLGRSVERPTDLINKEPPAPTPAPAIQTPPPPPADDIDHPGPPGPPRPDRPDDRRPPRNPIIEQWIHAQMEATIGQVAVGCGIILLLVGIARTGFARTERQYVEGTAPPK
jgi:hypothetical protein